MKKRKRVWRTSASEKEGTAKQGYATAYNSHRADGGAPPRTPPVMLRNSKTKKWRRWEEIDPANRTPAPLVPSLETVAAAMTTVEVGKARGTGRQASTKVQLNDAKHAAIVAAFQSAGKSDLLKPPLRLMAIQAELDKLSRLKPPAAETFVRRLRRHS